MANRFCDPLTRYPTAADLVASQWRDDAGRTVQCLVGGNNVVTNAGRWGVGAIPSGGGSGNPVIQFSFAASMSSFAFGAAITLASNATGSNSNFLRFQEGGTIHVSVGIMATGKLEVILGNTRGVNVLCTSASVFANSSSHTIEVVLTIADGTSGSVYLYVDNVLEASNAACDTKNGGSGVLDNIVMGGTNAAIGAGASDRINWSEVYLNDLTGGAPNNGRWGDWRVEEVSVSTAGTETEWTPLSSTNVSNVDEDRSDGDTSYNTAASAPLTDTFVPVSITPSAGTVAVAGFRVVAKKLDVGTSKAAAVHRQSGVDYPLTENVLGMAYKNYVELDTVNPATSAAFTVDEMRSGTEVGVQRTL